MRLSMHPGNAVAGRDGSIFRAEVGAVKAHIA